jgi:hypothetical protein
LRRKLRIEPKLKLPPKGGKTLVVRRRILERTTALKLDERYLIGVRSKSGLLDPVSVEPRCGVYLHAASTVRDCEVTTVFANFIGIL